MSLEFKKSRGRDRRRRKRRRKKIVKGALVGTGLALTGITINEVRNKRRKSIPIKLLPPAKSKPLPTVMSVVEQRKKFVEASGLEFDDLSKLHYKAEILKNKDSEAALNRIKARTEETLRRRKALS